MPENNKNLQVKSLRTPPKLEGIREKKTPVKKNMVSRPPGVYNTKPGEFPKHRFGFCEFACRGNGRARRTASEHWQRPRHADSRNRRTTFRCSERRHRA